MDPTQDQDKMFIYIADDGLIDTIRLFTEVQRVKLRDNKTLFRESVRSSAVNSVKLWRGTDKHHRLRISPSIQASTMTIKDELNIQKKENQKIWGKHLQNQR